jgi:polyisoprenoid-binding protein YceI
MKPSRILMLSAVLLLQQSSAFAVESIVKRNDAGLGVWKIDPAHTSAHFMVKHMMVSNVRGDFSKVSGTANYDGKALSNSSVSAVIDANSINTNEPDRDKHLKSADFFDVAKYPTISFKSTKVEPDANGFKIIGDLTMHGITKSVTLTAEPLPPPIKDPYGNLRIGTEATAKVNRKDFGLSFDQNLDNGGALVGDNVDITIDVELLQKPATAESKSTL